MRERRRVVDFVVQYETAVDEPTRTHAVVLRSDGSHAPHYDLYDRFGAKRTMALEPWLTPEAVIAKAIADIRSEWRVMRERFDRRL